METKDPGKLRHRATIDSPISTQGNLGQPVISGRTVVADRIPVRVVELSGRELEQAKQLQADITMRVELRWRPDIDRAMRVVWHDGPTDRTLTIEAPPLNPDGRKRWMHLLCKEPH